MNALAQIMRRMVRSRVEWHNGRIHENSWLWTFEPLGTDTVKLSRTRKNAVTIYLVDRVGISCPNKAKWAPLGAVDHEQSPDIGFLPQAICRQCEYRRKGGADRLKYPHCAWAKEQRGGDTRAVESMLTDYRQAVERAKEVLR